MSPDEGVLRREGGRLSDSNGCVCNRCAPVLLLRADVIE